MNKIQVTVNSSLHDCDCCGFFDVSDAIIDIGGDISEVHHDGHFGNGCWDGESDNLNFIIVSKIIGTSGFKIEHEDYTQLTCTEDNENYCTIYLSKQDVSVEYEVDGNVMRISVDVSDVSTEYEGDWYYNDDQYSERLLEKVCKTFGYDYPYFTYNHENFTNL